MALRMINAQRTAFQVTIPHTIRMQGVLTHPPQETRSPPPPVRARKSPAPPHLASPAHSVPVTLRPLARLPSTVLLRTLLTTLLTSTPFLLRPAIRILSAIAHNPSPLLAPDRNPLVRSLLRHTLYQQFCAGEDAAGVQLTLARLRAQGVDGVVLGWAREIERRGAGFDSEEYEIEGAASNIETWREGTSQTIDMVPEGQFAALKWRRLTQKP